MQIAKNIYLVILICFIIVISILIIANNTYKLLHNMEEFTNNNIDINICKSNNRRISQVSAYNNSDKFQILQNNKNILEFIGCTSIEYSDTLLQNMKDICYTTYQEFDSVSTYNIYQKITDDIYKTKITLADDITEPIYTIIYQENPNNIENILSTKVINMYPSYYYDNTQIKNFKSNIGLQNINIFFKSFVTTDTSKCRATIYQIKKRNLLPF